MRITCGQSILAISYLYDTLLLRSVELLLHLGINNSLVAQWLELPGMSLGGPGYTVQGSGWARAGPDLMKICLNV